MTRLSNLTSRFAALGSAALVTGLALLGCGDGTGLSPRYAVSGKVTYKGMPVEKGTINFAPVAADGRAAGGQIDNGYYTLTTLAPNDGALPGKYRVTVLSKERDETKLKEVAKGGQFHHDPSFFEANKKAKSLVPSKYGLADTSGLEREVKAQSNTIDIDLVD